MLERVDYKEMQDDRNRWFERAQAHEATIADLQGQLLEWKRALHSLTPGGSEYANDSKACVEWVRGVWVGMVEYKFDVERERQRNENLKANGRITAPRTDFGSGNEPA